MSSPGSGLWNWSRCCSGWVSVSRGWSPGDACGTTCAVCWGRSGARTAGSWQSMRATTHLTDCSGCCPGRCGTRTRSAMTGALASSAGRVPAVGTVSGAGRSQAGAAPGPSLRRAGKLLTSAQRGWWRVDTASSGGFANGLERDLAAVTAGLARRRSACVIEGHVNRIIVWSQNCQVAPKSLPLRISAGRLGRKPEDSAAVDMGPAAGGTALAGPGRPGVTGVRFGRRCGHGRTPAQADPTGAGARGPRLRSGGTHRRAGSLQSGEPRTDPISEPESSISALTC